MVSWMLDLIERRITVVFLDDLGIHKWQPEDYRQEGNNNASKYDGKGDSGLRELVKLKLRSTFVDCRCPTISCILVPTDHNNPPMDIVKIAATVKK